MFVIQCEVEGWLGEGVRDELMRIHEHCWESRGGGCTCWSLPMTYDDFIDMDTLLDTIF